MVLTVILSGAKKLQGITGGQIAMGAGIHWTELRPLDVQETSHCGFQSQIGPDSRCVSTIPVVVFHQSGNRLRHVSVHAFKPPRRDMNELLFTAALTNTHSRCIVVIGFQLMVSHSPTYNSYILLTSTLYCSKYICIYQHWLIRSCDMIVFTVKITMSSHAWVSDRGSAMTTSSRYFHCSEVLTSSGHYWNPEHVKQDK